MIGDKIKRRRKLENITQKELSSKTGLSISYIQQLEYNKKENPSLDALNKIAEALHIDIKNLVDSPIKNSQESKKISSEYNYFNDSVNNLKRSLDDSMRSFVIDGRDNKKVILSLITKLLEDITKSIEFYAYVAGDDKLKILSNKNSNLNNVKKNKLKKDIRTNCNQMSVYFYKVCTDLHNLISHTQSLVDDVLENIETNNK